MTKQCGLVVVSILFLGGLPVVTGCDKDQEDVIQVARFTKDVARSTPFRISMIEYVEVSAAWRADHPNVMLIKHVLEWIGKPLIRDVKMGEYVTVDCFVEVENNHEGEEEEKKTEEVP